MIRVLVDRFQSENKSYKEIACLSTDTKPVENICTGSICLEVDTGKAYFYDEEADSGEEWVEQFSFQG